MQWLSLVTEDAGVQRLKADNRQPVVARSLDAVSPYPAIHPARIGEGKVREPGARRERRDGERRQGERRQKQVPVLLDTRCGSRRGIENRRREAAEPDDAGIPAVRINVYA